MGNDYTARKLSKKKRKREGVEAGPNAAEGGSKKRRSKTRRLCRGVCYQEPLLTAEDRIWEAGSDGEDGNFDPQQGWAPDTPPRTPLPGPPGGIFGALGRLGLLQAGPERQGATAGSKVRPRDGSEGRVPEAEDGAAEQSTKHKKNRKKRAGKDKQQQQQQQQTEADAGGSETAGAAHKPQRKQRLSTAVDLIMPEDDKAPASKPSRAERETAVAGPALARFPEPIQRFMLSEGFTEPTDIQERCWPACMAGRDVQAVAEPGSGKTLGYLLPVLPRLLAEGQGVASRPDGPLVLIMAPTRELAQQIATTARLLRKLFGLRTACIFGGADRAVQIEALGKQPHLVVATPGRLLDFVDENILHLGNVEVVVLDEADKMLSLGLQPQLDRLHDALLPSKKAKAVAAATAAATAATITSEDGPARLQHPAKRPQVLLFTATMPESLDEVSARWLRKPEAIRVTSSSASISSTVVQVVHVCAEHKKPAKLQKHLQQIREKGKQLRNPPRVLIFANRVKTVRFLHKLLADDGCRVVMLHGERSQHEREEAMRDFRSGKAQILVATDVAARGLHIRNLPYVVNYDFPSQLDSYIHRVGRTGRVAMNGHAFSFLTRQMAPIARALLNLLQDHNQSIDPNLIKLAEAYELAAQKLGTTAAAAPAQSGSDADEEEEHAVKKRHAVPGRLRKKLAKERQQQRSTA
ncbi:hypothetical protein WJX72_006234 [[Myrmecia] bisecta]|uniref:Uncharacterized protein n=1 Tax=[Myrmecia] bisecta TaxID=41462 RepID=A0AAW1QRZ4_9CHLO